MFTSQKHKSLLLGALAVVIITAIAVGASNLENLQGATRIKNNQTPSAQQSATQPTSTQDQIQQQIDNNVAQTSASFTNAIEVKQVSPATQNIPEDYDGTSPTPVYEFSMTNHHTGIVDVYKVTANFAAKEWDGTTLSAENAWTLTSKRKTAYGTLYNSNIQFVFESPTSLKPNETANFVVSATLSIPSSYTYKHEATIATKLVKDATAGELDVTSATSLETLNTNQNNLIFFDETSGVYFTSAYNINGTSVLAGFPSNDSTTTTSCGSAALCQEPIVEVTMGDFLNQIHQDLNIADNSYMDYCTKDIAHSSEYYQAFEYAIHQGWLVQPLDSYCHPEKAVSREEAARIISMAYKLNPPYSGYWTDVPKGDAYAGYTESLYEKGIGKEYGNTFKPDQILSTKDLSAWMSGL